MTNVIFSARLSRRSLLASTAVCLFVSSVSAGALPIGQGMPWSPGTTRPPAPVRPGPWIFFSADEASLVEAAVDRPVPADERGPGGKDAGCAIFIDRQLAGPYGRADGLYMKPPFMSGAATQGYQMPDTPAAQYRGGLKALGEHVKNAFDGKSFSQLPTRDQDEVLAGIEAGSIALKDVNGAQFFALLLANAMEGSFADPIYGGNRDMAGWNLIGF